MDKEKVIQHFEDWKKQQEIAQERIITVEQFHSWLSGYIQGFTTGKPDLDPAQVHQVLNDVNMYFLKKSEPKLCKYCDKKPCERLKVGCVGEK